MRNFVLIKIQVTLYCPNCQSSKVKKNGSKVNGKQNYRCKLCNRQFICDHLFSVGSG